MKNWIYAALAALFATGCAPHGGYTLTGEVPEAWEGKPVVLFTTDAGQAEAIDSTTGNSVCRACWMRPATAVWPFISIPKTGRTGT